jgi:hypothetical protein|tara:strand:+ start:554 stop:5209 length:4656 start_codon:yes stop_codon:yes gene_type:complete
MPSSKNTPQALNKSSDERLLKPNEMSDAKNVTISTDDEGNGFVLKNARGTLPVENRNSGDQIPQDSSYEILGSCVDEEANMMYFAAYDMSSANPKKHGVYRIDFNGSDIQYEKVFETQYLFDTKPKFVDMDIIRADVNQEGSIESILYLTDNVTEPKKMNVSRAMDSSDAGGYSAQADIEEFLSVSKTKPVHNFVVDGKKDINFDGNFIYGKNISFAMQWVYKDGERSALSNISDCVIPQSVLTQEEDGSRKYDVNYYEVSIDKGNSEVKEINIYYRDNETGLMYLSDRMKRDEDLTRAVGSNETIIYDESESTYRFYGDRDQEPIALIEANKLYDNVPLRAKTQCIADGRLMYGNYTEGRALPEVKAEFEVEYNNPYGDDFLAIGTEAFHFDLSTALSDSDYDNLGDQSAVRLKLQNLPETVSAGTYVYLDFTFYTDKDCFITNTNSSTTHAFSFVHPNTGTYYVGVGHANPAKFRNLEDVRFRMVYEVPTTETRANVVQDIKTELESVTIVNYYRNTSNITSQAYLSTNPSTSAICRITQAKLQYKVDVQVTNTTNLECYLQFHDATDITIELGSGTATTGEDANPDGNNNRVGVISTDAGVKHSVRNSNKATLPGVTDFKTFKRGANHTFGMIFYDKKGRASFVRELGSVYVKTLGETTNVDDHGTASIKIKFPQQDGAAQTLPDWVDKYQIVYGGSDIDTFKQYSVSGGFANYWSYSEYDSDDAKEDASKNIYVSLKGWSGSKSSYTGENGANHVCNPVDGDILRVIHYDIEDDDQSVSRFYPEDLEFSVVGKTILRRDTVTDDVNLIRAEMEFENKRDEAKQRRRDKRKERRERKGKDGPGLLTKISDFGSKVIEKIGDNEDFPFLDSVITTRDERKDNLSDDEDAAIERLKSTPISARNAVFPGGQEELDNDGNVVANSQKDMAMAKGDFLIIKDPKVEGWGREDSVQVKFNSSNNIQTTTQASNGTNKHWFPILNWARNVVVEVYTPGKQASNRAYSELPYISSDNSLPHGSPIVVNGGDVWYKRVPVKLNKKEDNASNQNVDHYFRYWDIEGMEYTDMYLESEEGSHFFPSDARMFGRSHFSNKYAAENHRRHSITYSDKYSSDSPFLNLSSFNLSKANFTDLDSTYGGVDRLFTNDGYLTCVQSGKASRIPLGAVNVKLSATSDNLTSADTVLGSPSYYSGRYGTRGKTQASVMRDGRVYFLDVVAKKALQLAGDGITAISDIGMDSFFQDKLEAWDKVIGADTRVFTGYDPDYGEVLFAVHSGTGFDGFVAAYNEASKRWTSLYEFSNSSGAEPTLFENIGNKLVSALYTTVDPSGEEYFVHEHTEDATRSKFYGSQKTALVETVVNPNPSLSKVFNAVSYEGNSDTWDAVVTTSDQNTDITSWEERERSYFALMPRDKSSNSTSHKIGIPAVVDGATANNGIVINFASKVGRLGLPIGCNLYNASLNKYVTTDGEPGSTKVTLKGAAGKVITINETFTEAGVVADGNLLYAILDQSTYGDAIRDYFCKIKLSSSAASDLELYAINTHYDRSNLGPELTKK